MTEKEIKEIIKDFETVQINLRPMINQFPPDHFENERVIANCASRIIAAKVVRGDYDCNC
jgi:hypothetical protein